jgi:hypothetical protein
MSTKTLKSVCWTTASFGGAAETSPMELAELGDHLNGCKSVNSRLFALRCAAEDTDGFVSARFITTLVAAALLIGLVSLAL